MLIPLFINYLVKNQELSQSAADEVFNLLGTVRPKLIDLAVSAGFMTMEDVEEYNRVTDPSDLFEDAAEYEGFITQSQLFTLLKLQTRRDLILFEALDHAKLMSHAESKRLMEQFKLLYELSEDDYIELLNSNTATCLTKVIKISESELCFDYLVEMVSIVMQIVDPNMYVKEYYETDLENFQNLTTVVCVDGDMKRADILIGFSGSEDTLLKVASKYARTDIDSFSRLSWDALRELLNCVGGTYVGLLEEKRSLDFNLLIPNFFSEQTIKNPKVLQIMTEFGPLALVFAN